MRNILIVLFIVVISSCLEGESFEPDVSIIEIEYRGLYEEVMDFAGYKSMTFTDITIEITEEEISKTEKVKVLYIYGLGNDDESFIGLKVYADSIGDNLIYNGAFNIRTPPIGVPYDYYNNSIDFNVLVNNDIEFVAEFSGQLRHYVLYYNDYRFLNIRSGTIKYKY